MDVSVILSTYNAPDALGLAIAGYAAQTERGFELVVADDGSGPETRERIDALRASTGLEIVHVWQEDEGFRKCRILNKAIVAARGDYLVLSDGDCIPRDDFVAAHSSLARPGAFLSGGRVSIIESAGATLTSSAVAKGLPFDEDWLRERSALVKPRDAAKLTRSERRAKALDRMTTTRATWNGHNASAWKTDLLAVNGFDERMTYPVEDRELGERLSNFGIRGVQVRHRAVCAHIEHARPHVAPEVEARNERLRRETRGVPRSLQVFDRLVTGKDWTEHGIHKGPRPSPEEAVATD